MRSFVPYNGKARQKDNFPEVVMKMPKNGKIVRKVPNGEIFTVLEVDSDGPSSQGRVRRKETEGWVKMTNVTPAGPEIDPETLKRMTLKELKKTALGRGVPQNTVDEVDGKKDPFQAAIELILATAQEIETLKRMTLKELKKTALGRGVPQSTVDEVDDKEDPKQAAIDLVLATAQEIEILNKMTLKELKKTALGKGVPQSTVDEVDDKEDPKQAAIALILRKPRACNLQNRSPSEVVGQIEVARSVTRVHPRIQNPKQKTCWLSCTLHALWHAPVFQYAFERYLQTRKVCDVDNESPVLTSICEMWTQISSDPDKAVDPEKIADAMEVQGWGDSSEAVARVGQALEESPNPVAKVIGKGIVTIPMLLAGQDPTPSLAWARISEDRQDSAELIAVEFTPPDGQSKLDNDAAGKLADSWYPRKPENSRFPDLGRSHKVVAIICFIESCRHYVVFCARRSEPKKCRFFNDLPHTTLGIPQELEWASLPSVCNTFCLQLRLVLFESLDSVACTLDRLHKEDPCLQM